MALLPTGQWVRWTNLPSAADFLFTDLHRYSRCKQRFSLNFAAIDISLHANYALILLNTNCTNYTNKVYHQYSVLTILQVVTPISFEKSYICSPPQYRSALVATRMRIIVFILLLRGLPQEKCPSEAVCSKMELTSLVSAFFHP